MGWTSCSCVDEGVCSFLSLGTVSGCFRFQSRPSPIKSGGEALLGERGYVCVTPVRERDYLAVRPDVFWSYLSCVVLIVFRSCYIFPWLCAVLFV